MSEEWLQVAREALKLPGLLVEIYGDLARPGVRQVGKALETVLGLGNTILWPIACANERARVTLEMNLEKYRCRLETVADDRVVQVAPEIGVPIAEKLGYVRDEKLSDLYVLLLAKASKVDTLDQAHPSFVNVINNLSPDEASLLEYFTTSNDLPFVRAKAVVPATLVFSLLRDLIIPAPVAATVRFPQNIEAYLSNLAGLGVVTIHHDAWIDGSPLYAELETQSKQEMTAVMSEHEKLKDRELRFDKGVIAVTSYGRQFINACHVE